MMWRTVENLGNCWPSTVVEVDDTEAGMEEGLNAGSWTAGVSVRGNAMGLSLVEWQALPQDQQAERRAAAAKELSGAGAHDVIDSVADLLPVLDAIRQRMNRGERIDDADQYRRIQRRKDPACSLGVR